MKVFCHFSLLVVLLITVCSCKDDNKSPTPEQPTYSIIVEENDAHPVLPQEGGAVTIPFTTTGDWTASLMNDRAEGWITISPVSGKAGDVLLSVSVKANDTYDERSATIVLKSGDDTENIVVNQKQKDAILLSSSKYEVEAQGGKIKVEVQANVPYEVEIGTDWITEISTRAVSTHIHHYQIAPNENYDAREAKIVFHSLGDENLADTVSVYQAQKGTSMTDGDIENMPTYPWE